LQRSLKIASEFDSLPRLFDRASDVPGHRFIGVATVASLEVKTSSMFTLPPEHRIGPRSIVPAWFVSAGSTLLRLSISGGNILSGFAHCHASSLIREVPSGIRIG
jgi:hypothetical protein